jgi:hypothetical protein
MVFKVIIKHPSTEGDENTYYGIVFPNRDIGQIKRLSLKAEPKTLEETFTFDDSKVKVGEHFLAILVTVNESEITDRTCGMLACQMGTNSDKPQPEVVKFGY